MEQVILDTNFILICVKQKIHLFEELDNLFGVYALIIPEQVLDELEKIKFSNISNLREKESAKLALHLIDIKNTKKIDLGTQDVDAGIIRYVKDKEKTYVATLDRNLKLKIKQRNPKIKFLIIRQKTRIIIQ